MKNLVFRSFGRKLSCVWRQGIKVS